MATRARGKWLMQPCYGAQGARKNLKLGVQMATDAQGKAEEAEEAEEGEAAHRHKQAQTNRHKQAQPSTNKHKRKIIKN